VHKKNWLDVSAAGSIAAVVDTQADDDASCCGWKPNINANNVKNWAGKTDSQVVYQMIASDTRISTQFHRAIFPDLSQFPLLSPLNHIFDFM